MRSFLIISIICFLYASHTSAQFTFQEITQSAGANITDAKSHGVSFGDFDNDGDQDLFISTRLQANKLFRNNGDLTFTDVAVESGIANSTSSRAAAWGDFNNDGYLDLYVGNYQTDDKLYLNSGPEGSPAFSFIDVSSEAGITNAGEVNSVQLADIDNDGFLDIYVLNFQSDNVLYKNQGNGSFADKTFESGVNDAGNSMSSLFFDYDLDGDLDLYIVHDFEEANILYQNDGTGFFTNVAIASNLDLAAHGMGVDAADINRDGYPDLYITDLEENYLFLNNQNGTFTDISSSAGIEDTGMGWSTFFLDFDNDGNKDIYVVNDSDFSPEPNVLYRNNGDNTFTKVEVNGPISSAKAGVGGATADIDGNGTQDIVITNPNSSTGSQLFQNIGNSNNWVSINLNGTISNTSAIGARVRIDYGTDQVQFAEVRSGNGFGSASTQIVHFGLREFSDIQNIEVVWPNGIVNNYSDLTANRFHTLTETPAPLLTSIRSQQDFVERYAKFEAVVGLTATYDNPHDYSEVQVSATFTGPDGMTRIVDGYYHEDFSLNTSNGTLTPQNADSFRIRFSPDQIGEWTYQVSVEDAGGTAVGDLLSFTCTQVTSNNNKGFVRTGATNYLEYDNGDQLILIGENIAWQNSNVYTNYRRWVNALADNGGNFLRLWHAHWGLGIEWKEGFQRFDGLRRYEARNSFYQDWLYDFCAERGVTVMLTIQHHGPVSTNVNPNWNDSPYNAANGGPCQNTWDFFTNEEAKDHTKNRLRYIIARWGYSRAIQSWELFNEVNWTDNYQGRRVEVSDWHAEMAAYIKQLDPYNHSVTTSFAHSDEGGLVWPQEDMDFTQTHYYLNSSNIERALAGGVQQYLVDYDKPTLTGEFGLGGSPNLSNADADGIHLHNGMWGALFAGGMGTAMSWWWDVYIHPRDLYYHFAPIALVTDEIPLLAKDMQPTDAFITGAPGDLIISPVLSWGSIGDQTITINANGATSPATPQLNQYLYGSQFNTNFRSPPTFVLNYPEAATFTVRTNTERGQGAKISLYLDGNLLLDEAAIVNTDFTINVPAGRHEILVDNLGTDWATISSYTFEGIGSDGNTYALRSPDAKVAAGWILNHKYNHLELAENGVPDPILGANLVIDSMAAGSYYVKWYDCLTGQITHAEPAVAANGRLSVDVPDLLWDLAFRIDEDVVIGTQKSLPPLAVTVTPNPVKAGDQLRIQFSDQNIIANTIQLFSSEGRSLLSISNSQTLDLPATLPSGYYLVSVMHQGQVATKGIIVK